MGLLAVFGVELDLFSVFSLLMCIGIGVDYGIHVLHRYALEGAHGMSEALTTIGPAILLALATTGIGFATLGGSSYAPLRSMGYASAITATTCLIAALIVLPAMLPEHWRERTMDRT
jgi:predicted RND superfamily exporter protein